MSLTTWLIAFAAATSTSCGTNYIYVPEGATTWSQGNPVTRIAVPPEEPKGEVRVASFGLTRLELSSSSPRVIDVIHLRMTVGNDSDARPWIVDTREQLLEISGEGRSRPIFVNSDRDAMPIVSINRREQRILDLYYPLPSTVTGDVLPRFDLLWQVQTGERVVAQRTSFDRIEFDPDSSLERYATWAPFWWHDPLYYSSFGFTHHYPIVVDDRDGRSPVIVSHRP